MWNGRNVHQTFELQGKNIQIPGNNYASAVEIDNPSIKRKAAIGVGETRVQNRILSFETKLFHFTKV